LVEFFPHDDDRKGEQHRVEHTNCGKLKAGNSLLAQIFSGLPPSRTFSYGCALHEYPH
jgi:hypothetical protein